MSWPVLTPEGVPVTELVVGQDVQVMSLSGRVPAKVAMFDYEPTPEPQTWYETKKLGAVTGAYAEDEFNCYPLRLEEGQWVNSSAWSKRAMARLLKESEP